jgi:hypothetical protein
MIQTFCFQSDPEPSQLAKIRYADSNPEVLFHRTRAIQLINERLNEGVASSTIVATVLVLVLHHVSSDYALVSSPLGSLVTEIDMGWGKTRSRYTFHRTEKIDRASWRLENAVTVSCWWHHFVSNYVQMLYRDSS